MRHIAIALIFVFCLLFYGVVIPWMVNTGDVVLILLAVISVLLPIVIAAANYFNLINLGDKE